MERVIVFGAGDNYRKLKEKLENQYNILAVVDNKYKEIGHSIKSPEYIRETSFDKIIITPNIFLDIYKQLINMGVDPEKIVIYGSEVDDYKMNILGNSYWGQHADDLIVEAIFSRINILKPSYIDLGCNHPSKCSNTIALYINGCRGINIDASPQVIDIVNIFKTEDININRGVAAKTGVLKFYMANDCCGRNSFVKEEMRDMEVKKTIDVPVVTLKSIIDEYCPDGFPDFLDCDIEGLDYEVLESYDFLKDGPKVICVEVREKDINKFDDMLDGKGYYKFCRIGENNIYVQKKYSNVVSHMSME
ncbi:methyltransferase, FkbM family [Pseudobutyrivibrio sp. 49]|uniref:FkbM family methyltransferase n=1 Tax=Pseudobutyrivibrio sp. 49 TaxID=1855344 RepID=UPI00088E631D|nr:FkbM family methyltransferase [Pseudobutyrivibrio sp. 49]SDH92173.1 methyltransferase, FkbM family [Pseudobutyrivibrio sp. 49]